MEEGGEDSRAVGEMENQSWTLDGEMRRPCPPGPLAPGTWMGSSDGKSGMKTASFPSIAATKQAGTQRQLRIHLTPSPFPSPRGRQHHARAFFGVSQYTAISLSARLFLAHLLPPEPHTQQPPPEPPPKHNKFTSYRIKQHLCWFLAKQSPQVRIVWQWLPWN